MTNHLKIPEEDNSSGVTETLNLLTEVVLF